ncbi:MAG: 13E12 repeat family protein, partial [Actinomycetota bacterium]|nr:13E12 repeat family protein [Actinomycetota bacterium]
MARAFEDMPQTRLALEVGDISMSAVRLLATARDADPDTFGRAEAQLVEAARLHSVADLQRVVAYWRERVEQERMSEGREDDLRARRRLHASVSLGGMVRVDGDLDPESGETLLTALRAVLDTDARSRGRDDDRTPAQRRADALGEICRQWLDDGGRPVVAGERPHLTITVDAESLQGDAVGASELDHTGPVRSDIVRRLACDASVMRVV